MNCTYKKLKIICKRIKNVFKVIVFVIKTGFLEYGWLKSGVELYKITYE